MTRPSWIIFNFLFYLILLLLAASLQTSLLHWVFGWRATIQIVLVIITYICLYRDPTEALIFTVVSCYATGLLSTMAESLSVFAGMCMFLALRMLRRQIYSSNSVYFTWTALASILGFHILTWLTSVILVPKRPKPHPLDWILEVLVTALFARFLYSLFVAIDRKTKRLTITELNS